MYDLISIRILFVLVECCKSVIISSVSGPAKALGHGERMGQYDYLKMGPNARTIYRDFFKRTISTEQFLFVSVRGKWSVSTNVYIHMFA